MSAQDVMSATSTDINGVGAGFYFDATTLGTGKEAGLDGFRLYIVGRGGVMGDVNAEVVQASFGYFSPKMLVPLWNTGIETMPARDVAALYWKCAADFGRSKLADAEGLAEFCAAAETVIAAADRDGLPLFAGAAAMPLVEDLAGRAYQLSVVLRELRGSAHLAAVRAAGLQPRQAHAAKRPEMVEMFGWKDITVGDDVEAKLVRAEEMTDAALEECYSALDEAGEAAFVAGVSTMTTALAN